MYYDEKKQCIVIKKKYFKYDNTSFLWVHIFEEIDEMREYNRAYIDNISKKYKLNYETLKKKYGMWCDMKKSVKDKNQKEQNQENKEKEENKETKGRFEDINIKAVKDENRSDNSKKNEMDQKNQNEILCKERRGGHNRFFNDKEEKDLYNHIVKNYIDLCLYFDDDCLKYAAIDKWNNLHPDKKDEFKCSHDWVSTFKKKFRLSSQRARYSKVSPNLTDKAIEDYLQLCMTETANVERQNIFNLDETFWRILISNNLVIGHIGAENRKIISNVDPKTGFTAVFLISAAGIFHKPLIIFAGSTPKCLEKSGQCDDRHVFRKFTANGWIRADIIMFLLYQIYKITKGKRSVLILDQFSVHTEKCVQITAAKLKIKLIFVPVGATSKYQPLDVLVNGSIKSSGKKITKEMYIKNPHAQFSIKDSVTSLIEVSKLVKSDTIIKSFSRATNIF